MRSLRDTLDALKLDTLALKAVVDAFAVHDTFNHLKVEELYHAPFISSMNLGAFWRRRNYGKKKGSYPNKQHHNLLFNHKSIEKNCLQRKLCVFYDLKSP